MPTKFNLYLKLLDTVRHKILDSRYITIIKFLIYVQLNVNELFLLFLLFLLFMTCICYIYSNISIALICFAPWLREQSCLLCSCVIYLSYCVTSSSHCLRWAICCHAVVIVLVSFMRFDYVFESFSSSRALCLKILSHYLTIRHFITLNSRQLCNPMFCHAIRNKDKYWSIEFSWEEMSVKRSISHLCDTTSFYTRTAAN